jgi:cytochrome c peroxidase
VGSLPGQDLDKQVVDLRNRIRTEFGVKLPPLPVPENNPQSSEKIYLGEALFFDPNLSSCGEIACASCHIPERGFSDGEKVSDGCGGATGRRNSNSVYQNAFLSHFFWDGRVQSLEQQALGPVVDPAEMANSWDNVLKYLETGVHPVSQKEFPASAVFYKKYFQRVFKGEITTTNVAKAIAAYERTAVSFDSPYDKWLQGDDNALTERQEKGALIFFGRGNCAECHVPPNFTDSDFHNISVPSAGFETKDMFPHNREICGGIEEDVDPGRAEVSFLRTSSSDLGRFKTPTLRNVALSGPYMHNGVFPALEDVMHHYEMLARGVLTPMVGESDEDVLAARLGDGGGEMDDISNLTEFMKALTGTSLSSPKRGIAPPSPGE